MKLLNLTLFPWLAATVLALTWCQSAWAKPQSPNPSSTTGKPVDSRWCQYLPGAGVTDTGKHIVLIAGDDEYRSEEALPMLGKILAQRLGYTCTVLFPVDEATGEIKPDHQTNIPGMHHLANADLAIIGLRFRGLPDDQMKFFDDYLMAGKPIMALRTSTHAFRFTNEMETSFRHYDFRGTEQWPGGFGKQVLGETWVSHHGDHGQQSTRGIPTTEHADDVLLTGVTDVWGPTDVYGIRELPQDCKILLEGQVIDGMSESDPPSAGPQNNPMMPLAWTRNWTTPAGEACAIFCTTMGSSTDFQSAGLRRLIINTALQFTGMPNRISADLDVSVVDDYQPTQFGFNAYQKGRKPKDYDLPTRNP